MHEHVEDGVQRLPELLDPAVTLRVERYLELREPGDVDDERDARDALALERRRPPEIARQLFQDDAREERPERGRLLRSDVVPGVRRLRARWETAEEEVSAVGRGRARRDTGGRRAPRAGGVFAIANR